MKKLAFIVPFCNEWPLIASTLRGIGEAMRRTDVDFEVVAVDNWMPEAGEQRHKKLGYKFGKDRGHEIVESMAEKIPWLKVVHYHEKLSHWNAKRVGADATDANILMFIDAHCVPPRNVIAAMYWFYSASWEEIKGSLHLPLTYHLLEETRLIYKMRWRKDLGDLDYVFTNAPKDDFVVLEVPCMSTCGMMIHRSILDRLGGWPEELGIYGGGEHWLNYSMAISGYKKYVMGNEPLYHHGDERGYQWNMTDYVRNRLIAIFLWGNVEKMQMFAEGRPMPSRRVMFKMIRELTETESLVKQKELIENGRVCDIEDFISEWDGKDCKRLQ